MSRARFQTKDITRRDAPLYHPSADSGVACPGGKLNDLIRSYLVSVSASSRGGTETLIDQQIPRLIAPRQQSKWGDAIIQQEDDGLRTHATLGVESHVDCYPVCFAGLRRDV